MSTGTIVFVDSVHEKFFDGTIDIDNDAFAVMLLTSSHTPNRTTDEFVSDISANEVSGGGYARQVLGSVTWAASGGANGEMAFDAANPVWTASGGTITARYYAVFDNTPATDATKPLICYGLLDNTPADVSATDGNQITFQVNANGIFRVAPSA